MSFHCPQCDGKTGVTETRAELRKRQCSACGYTFATEEIEFDGKLTWGSTRKRLTPEQKAIIKRGYRRGIKVATIARNADCSENTVYLHIARLGA